MTRKCLFLKAQKPPKFKSRVIRRCSICGRPRSVIRDYGICRLCFRKAAHEGQLPGMRKASL